MCVLLADGGGKKSAGKCHGGLQEHFSEVNTAIETVF